MAELERLLGTLTELGVIGFPAAPEQVMALERRIGTALPSDVLALYSRSDGTFPATPVDRGWVRLWSLAEWRPVGGILADPQYSVVGKAEVFADHCDNSWYYALDVSLTKGAIYIVDGLRPPRVVALSVVAFLEDVLADRDSIYPRDDGA